MIKKYLYILLSGILAGIFIAIGATVNLAILSNGNNEIWAKVIGSLFFGIGLFSVIIFDTWLYTGKVGFISENKGKYIIDLLICFIGNFIGTFLISLIISYTRFGINIEPLAKQIVETKQNDSWYSILILSFMCGMMIYLAVKGHKLCPYSIGKVLLVFLSVSVFILCGFEHVIANISYYTYGKFFDMKALGYFALMFVGNALGSIVLDGLFKLILKLKNK